MSDDEQLDEQPGPDEGVEHFRRVRRARRTHEPIGTDPVDDYRRRMRGEDEETR
ncbi:hypothetical protein ACL02T_12660 [Pseudonocardia sp. RS010]|uniref:hypothetical protein n=1 Tax=Pseudonocardia sp. RS010 TaxID=3385979 RepID=UPI0039A08905